MYTDLICPKCGELAPRIEKEIILDAILPVADKYCCQNCKTTWHLIMISGVNPLILNLTEREPAISLVEWVNRKIASKRRNM